MKDNFNLAKAVWQHSQKTPDAVAIVYQGQSLSYAQFADRARRVAQRLAQSPDGSNRANKPIKVGVLASRGMDAAVAILGACWAGAAFVPMGLKLPPDKILAIMAACEFSALIVDNEGDKLLTDEVLAACPTLVIRVGPEAWTDVLADPLAFHFQEPAPMNADDLAYVIFTSGTTGAPKGVMIAAGSVRNYIQTVAQKLNLQSTDRALETCEITFDVSVHNMFATWQVGATVFILPANLVMNAVKFAQAEQLTVWNSVPSLVGLLQQIKVLAPGGLPALRLSVFGGEALPQSAARQWQEVAPNSAIVNLYGPTEATVFCLVKVFAPNAPITSGRGFVSIGSPLGGCEAMVVDAAGKELPDGTPGELVIGGVQLAQGYLGAPELSAKKFPVFNEKRWYLTGDSAIRDAAGEFHFLGRMDNQIKVSGYRIELEEIDIALRLVSGRDLVGAVAWPIVDGVVKGIVGFIAGAAMDDAELISGLKQALQPYMVPQRVIALAHMPLNASGKVDRKALTELLKETVAVSV